MPPITALLHTLNDETHLGRSLESLRPCDEIVIVDRGSTDRSVLIAREYGATVYAMTDTERPERFARCPWVFAILPSESLSEALECSLYEWKLYSEADVDRIATCSVLVRVQSGTDWAEANPETRLVRRDWLEWSGPVPLDVRSSTLLQGDLYRFPTK